MSDDILRVSSDKYAMVVGVLKFNYLKAGYPDVMKIADEWAKDTGFLQIVQRKVSPDNWGIQFVYILPQEQYQQAGQSLWEVFNTKFIAPYKESTYAMDISCFPGNKENELYTFVRSVPFIVERGSGNQVD